MCLQSVNPHKHFQVVTLHINMGLDPGPALQMRDCVNGKTGVYMHDDPCVA